MTCNLEDVRLIHLPTFDDDNGSLTFFQGNERFPFHIARIFVVTASAGSVRGAHAHKKCSQLLLCTIGTIIVSCKDVIHSKSYTLKDTSEALLIPPGIWAEQQYTKDTNSLVVICDEKYDPDDYIRDFEEFKTFHLDS